MWPIVWSHENLFAFNRCSCSFQAVWPILPRRRSKNTGLFIPILWPHPIWWATIIRQRKIGGISGKKHLGPFQRQSIGPAISKSYLPLESGTPCIRLYPSWMPRLSDTRQGFNPNRTLFFIGIAIGCGLYDLAQSNTELATPNYHALCHAQKKILLWMQHPPRQKTACQQRQSNFSGLANSSFNTNHPRDNSSRKFYTKR